MVCSVMQLRGFVCAIRVKCVSASVKQRLCYLVTKKGGAHVTAEYIHRLRRSVRASAGMLLEEVLQR